MPRRLFPIAVVLPIFVGSLFLTAQQQITTTECCDANGNRLTSQTVVTERDNRLIETREQTSTNGDLLWTETEQELTRSGPSTTTIVKRLYSRDYTGNRMLVQSVEEVRSTADDGRESVVRTTSVPDPSEYGSTNMQAIEREVRESTHDSNQMRHTTSTVFRPTVNGLEPVQRSVEWDAVTGERTEHQTTVFEPDTRGAFVPVWKIESTTAKSSSGQRKEDRTYWASNVDAGQAHMRLVERDVTTLTKDDQDTHTTTDMYSAFGFGTYRKPGEVVLVQQVSASERTEPDGTVKSEQQIRALTSTDPTSGLQPMASIVSVSRPASNVTEIQITRSADRTPGLPIRVTDSRGTRLLP
jgi:hypothetical protein